MVIEMPVLDNALLGCALSFTPLMVGADVRRAGDEARRRAPRGASPAAAAATPTSCSTCPPGTGPGRRLLQGLFFGRIAPHRSERRTFQTPALVIGHPRDPMHPFSDAGMLADELPNGRLIEANSLVELRMRPSG